MNINKVIRIKPLRNDQTGSLMVSILVVSIFFVLISSSLIILANANISRAKGRVLLLQAQYAAESGVDSAIAQLNSGNENFAGSNNEVQILTNSRYKSTYNVTVTGSGKERLIRATGKVYIPANNPVANFSRSIEVKAERSSETSTSSIVSRNIIDISSSVKSVTAKTIYANGYINMAKNGNKLISESITVVNKLTNASNCSINGAGSLEKPTSFSNPSQTKTNVTLGYNNCVTLSPNNNSFNLLTGQTNLSKIQSTLIPWSQYMDSSYQNSFGGDCRDWTTGGAVRTIPSAGNAKKTHYPDSNSNISSSCGINGDLNLGSNTYVITDNVHLRANLCASSACSPIFKNPDNGTLKFVFIEGSINFDSIRTTADSGPIAFISYGPDPTEKAFTDSCPLGASVYIGQGSPGSQTDAPDAYFLATNGICLDKTKFGENSKSTKPALGGLSGKNIYINSNSGTPWDLQLDPNFPLSEIKVDLAWRAVQYRRL